MAESLQKKAFRFRKRIGITDAKDTGMALVLIVLICDFVWDLNVLKLAALILLIVNMTIPNLYKPAAKLWLGVSTILGTFVSKIILTLIFFGLVTPVGIIRRILGKDSLQLNKWKNGSESVFQVRDHTFVPSEIEKPF